MEARSLPCCWAVREPGIRGTSFAKRLGMRQPGVGYAVQRGEKIAFKIRVFHLAIYFGHIVTIASEIKGNQVSPNNQERSKRKKQIAK